MSGNADQTDPSGRSREQILKDLETAGLLRHVAKKPAVPTRTVTRSGAVVLPFRRPDPKPSARTFGKRQLAIAAYILIAAMAAWLYLTH